MPRKEEKKVADRSVFRWRRIGKFFGEYRGENVDMSNVHLRENRRSRKSQDSFALENSKGWGGLSSVGECRSWWEKFSSKDCVEKKPCVLSWQDGTRFFSQEIHFFRTVLKTNTGWLVEKTQAMSKLEWRNSAKYSCTFGRKETSIF